MNSVEDDTENLNLRSGGTVKQSLVREKLLLLDKVDLLPIRRNSAGCHLHNSGNQNQNHGKYCRVARGR